MAALVRMYVRARLVQREIAVSQERQCEREWRPYEALSALRRGVGLVMD